MRPVTASCYQSRYPDTTTPGLPRDDAECSSSSSTTTAIRPGTAWKLRRFRAGDSERGIRDRQTGTTVSSTARGTSLRYRTQALRRPRILMPRSSVLRSTRCRLCGKPDFVGNRHHARWQRLVVVEDSETDVVYNNYRVTVIRESDRRQVTATPGTPIDWDGGSEKSISFNILGVISVRRRRGIRVANRDSRKRSVA